MDGSAVERAAEGELAGSRVTVLGLGLFGGGAGVARWALGCGAEVVVTDLRGEDVLAESVEELTRWAADAGCGRRLRFVLGRHERDDVRGADLLVVNPGVPPRAEMLEVARACGVPRTTAVSLLLDRIGGRVAAITGTQGKSSTTTFLGQALRSKGGDVHVGGNIGGSLLDEIDGIAADTNVVLEFSSYQLEHLAPGTRRALEVAAITNVDRDHLAWHGSVEAYRSAKLRILELLRPGGTAVVPTGELADAARAARPDVEVVPHGADGALRVDDDGTVRLQDEVLADLGALRVRGDFQRANAAVALGCARRMGLGSQDTAAAVQALEGLPHRLQDLGRHRLGSATVELVDNGVSTTPESTLSALDAIDLGSRPGYLLCGGAPKRDLAFDRLARGAAKAGWTLVPFGQAADELAQAAAAAGGAVLDVERSIPHHEAVRAALTGALRGPTAPAEAVVLLSPACASFDGYPNFRSRALAFREALTENIPERSTSKD